MRRFVAVLVVGLVASSPVSAQSAKAAPADTMANEMVGGWKVERGADDLTGNRYTIVSVDANNDARETASLAFRCFAPKPKRSDVLIVTTAYLSTRPIGVQYRFDGDEKVKTEIWSATPKGNGTYNTHPKALFERVMASPSVVVRLYDYNDVPHTWKFDLSGAADALAKLPCKMD